MSEYQTRKFRLLLVEDNQDRIDKIHTWLPVNFELVIAANVDQAVELLKQNNVNTFGAFMLSLDIYKLSSISSDLIPPNSSLEVNLALKLAKDSSVLVISNDIGLSNLIGQGINNAGFDVTSIPFENFEKGKFLTWAINAYMNWAFFSDYG